MAELLLAWFAWHGAAAAAIGALVAILVPLLLDWGSRPSALVARDFGVLSWLLSLLALAAAVWSFRDYLAWRRLRRASVAP